MSDLTAEEREARRLERKAQRQRERRAEIVAEATALIDEGKLEFSVQELADRLGISQPSVFYYFDGGKDELLTEVAWADFARHSDEIVERCTAASDGITALETLVRTRVDQFERDWERFTFVYETVLKVPFTETERDADFYRQINSLFDVVTAKIERDQEAGLVRGDVDARLRVHSVHRQVVGILHSEAMRKRAAGDSRHSTAAFADDLCRQVRHSMQAAT